MLPPGILNLRMRNELPFLIGQETLAARECCRLLPCQFAVRLLPRRGCRRDVVVLGSHPTVPPLTGQPIEGYEVTPRGVRRGGKHLVGPLPYCLMILGGEVLVIPKAFAIYRSQMGVACWIARYLRVSQGSIECLSILAERLDS
jgi:hypothetical protein